MVTPMGRVQSQGYLGRMRIYFAEMYPVPQRLIFAAIFYTSFVAFLLSIHNIEATLRTPYTLTGIWSIFAFMLILRLMDELKDREIDRQLFSERPVPSGRVLERDVVSSLIAVIVLFLLANLWTGRALWMALIVLGYTLLMFRYFFIPGILRKYLLLNLVTHNPVIAILLGYVVVLFSVEHGMALSRIDGSRTTLLIVTYWSVLFAWEISRKIRAPEEENAYVTYSQILSPAGAVAVALGAQTLAFAIGIYLYRVLALSWLFPAILVVGYARTVMAYVRFLRMPNPVTSNLKPYAEQYGMCLFVARLLSYFFPL
jgi:4-hydroxybenzoate polyprenyltransferase